MIVTSIILSERSKAPPVRVEGTWEELVEDLAEYRPTACTLATCLRSTPPYGCPHKKGKAWLPASWPEGAERAKATVELVSCFVVDRDHVPPDKLDGELERFAAYTYVMHSSHSDSPSDRCVRIVVQLSRPVSGRDWPRFWRAAVNHFGVKADENCKDASRLYFLPSRPSDASHDAFDGSGFDYAVNDGVPLDVDAILAIAGPVEPDVVRGPANIPAFSGAPSPVNYQAAVEALGAAWPPRGTRHNLQLALAGALARAGWPVELIGQFCHDVAEVAEPGTGELHKRIAAARSSLEKLAVGAPVKGWPRIEESIGPDAVTAATRALGMGLPDADLSFVETMQRAARRGGMSSIPSRLELRTAIEKARDTLKKSKRLEDKFAGKLLAKVLKGEILTDHADEDREKTLLQATLAVVRAVPANAPQSLITEFLLGPAGVMGADVSEMVEDAVNHIRTAGRGSSRDDDATEPAEGDLPDPQNDDELREQLILTDKGQISGCGSNIERILRFSNELRGNIRFNALSKQIEVTGGRFCDETPNGFPTGVKNWLSSHWHLTSTTSEIAEQILRVAQRWASYEPVAEYLNGHTWDHRQRVGGIDRPGWLTTYLGVDDSPYVRKVGARFLISAVARALDPGCKVDTVLVLEGVQGAKKSTTIGILGAPWFSSTPIAMGDKDSRLLAASKWICELAELASLSKGDVDGHKAFISQEFDDFRPPYGKVIETFPRRCVFFGSVNDEEYLQDPTGNRRWWAVYVGRCLDELLERDRDQLWAEAVYRYRSAELYPDQAHPKCPGERWWFEFDEQVEADDAVRNRLMENPWIERVRSWLTRQLNQTGTRAAPTHWSTADIAEQALDLKAPDQLRYTKKLNQTLRAVGLKRAGNRADGQRLWCRAGAVVMMGDPSSVMSGDAEPMPAPDSN